MFTSEPGTKGFPIVHKQLNGKQSFAIITYMKMRKLGMKTKVAIGAVILIAVLGALTLKSENGHDDRVITIVERGSVQDIVSVSGFVEAKNTAGLSFPVVGIVTDVFVEEGTEVQKGDLLATLGSSKFVAQRSDAVAILQKAQAARDELVSGPTQEARTVTQTTVTAAETSLNNTIVTEAEKVANARAALLSNDLEIRAVLRSERAVVPTLSGSYTCENEGAYNLSVYSSAGYAGYSYVLTGIEEDRTNIATRQPAQLGTCGLFLQFEEDEKYTGSEWIVEIPNTKGASYVTYKNAYDLAIQQETQNVQAAKDTFALATDNATFSNAAPSSAALRQVNASVYSAQARVAQIDAQIKDLSIVAPFNGVITDVDIRPGETAGATPVITILAQDAFELKARIPEIDITKILIDQHASVVFDAQVTQTLTGTIIFVSPLATEIDGVAYFNTTIALDQTPEWIRSGLNADIDIIVAESNDVLRIPKRFLVHEEDGSFSVLLQEGKKVSKTNITTFSTGNNGYIAITGLNEGDIVVAP